MRLGDRMKNNYENRNRIYLTRRLPVVIRLDGKAFHSLTKNAKMNKPFDKDFIWVMQETTKKLCENIQGCKLGYVESDEISLLLTDYDTLETEAWLDYNVQKMVSISASMATYWFNYFMEQTPYRGKVQPGYFDSRCFNLPKEEVNNYFLFRQQDCTRNSIEGLAQSLYPHKELIGINCKQLQNKMLTEKNINWNNCSTVEKRGSCIIRKLEIDLDKYDSVFDAVSDADRMSPNGKWSLDKEIPIFSDNKNYIERLVNVGE